MTSTSPPTPTDLPLSLENATQNEFSQDGDFELFFPLYLRLWVTITSGIIFIVGISGNILVPILMWKNRQMRHSTNIFLLNLAVADALILMVCLPTALVELHTHPDSWVMGPVLCRLVPFIEISVSRASVFTLAVISIERYVAICKPLTANSLCTRPRALGVSLGIWPLSFVAASPVIPATQFFPPSPPPGLPHPICVTSLTDPPWTSGYFLGSTFFFFVLPFFFLSSVYFCIGRKLLSHRARSNRKVDNAHWRSRKQVAAMLGAVVVIFFVCLLPFQVLVVWVIQTPLDRINNLGPHVYPNILYACRVLVYINAAANPIIYNAMSAKFRNALLRLLGLGSKGKSLLRRQSTLTTTLSSSSNASSRSNSFRRMANLALKRSFSDAAIRRNVDGPRMSSPSVLGGAGAASPFSSRRAFPFFARSKDERYLDRWYFRKGTSGSYFSGDSVSSVNTLADDHFPLRSFHPARLKSKAKYSPLLWELQNGYLQERNRSLPELYPLSSPGPAKRVSFKDSVLPRDRPMTVSPLTFNSLTEEGLSRRKDPKKVEKVKKEFPKTLFGSSKKSGLKVLKSPLGRDGASILDKERRIFNVFKKRRRRKVRMKEGDEEDEKEEEEEVGKEEKKEEETDAGENGEDKEEEEQSELIPTGEQQLNGPLSQQQQQQQQQQQHKKQLDSPPLHSPQETPHHPTPLDKASSDNQMEAKKDKHKFVKLKNNLFLSILS